MLFRSEQAHEAGDMQSISPLAIQGLLRETAIRALYLRNDGRIQQGTYNPPSPLPAHPEPNVDWICKYGIPQGAATPNPEHVNLQPKENSPKVAMKFTASKSGGNHHHHHHQQQQRITISRQHHHDHHHYPHPSHHPHHRSHKQ